MNLTLMYCTEALVHVSDPEHPRSKFDKLLRSAGKPVENLAARFGGDEILKNRDTGRKSYKMCHHISGTAPE